MLMRILVGTVLVGGLAVIWTLGGLWIQATIYVFLWLAIYEVHRALSEDCKPPLIAGLLYAVCLPGLVHYYQVNGLLVCLVIAAMAAMSVQVFRQEIALAPLAYAMLVLIYPGTLMGFLAVMPYLPDDLGRWAILFTVLYSAVTDSFAYFVGSMLGKHRLCPHLSPKKTVEGTLGGFLGGLLTSVLLYLFVLSYAGISTGFWQMILLGLVASLVDQIGDLTASLVKRATGIKDFGKIFPGHGGAMDRLDSILFIAPVMYAFFRLYLI